MSQSQTTDPNSQFTGARRPTSLAGLKVLVAEDQEMVSDLITILLLREKVSVTAVRDGAAALRALETQVFDVVLMDMNMPVMSGFEATRRIRHSGLATADVPILALTANVQKAEIAQCHRVGMDGHIAKPFTTDVLIAAIANAVASR
jgi:CheY-like chemotaxis protein